MEIFESILVMLSVVLFSNILSRFIPSISIPLIQIFLGVLLALIFRNYELKLSSELFMLLFLAPLLFNEGANVDKPAFWKERKAIFSLSIILVFVTVGILGYFIHWLVPSAPLAGSMALGAALAPTDAVAVSALAEKVKISPKMMHILEGESLINDASGLVSFQFAVAAMLTGTFSIIDAGLSFFVISLGGIAVGITLSFFELKLVSWLRSLGHENTISFMLMELLLPFLIFVIAEQLKVNGILAVVGGGMLHSVRYHKMNPEIAKLNLLSKNTWSVFSFSLNGLVFLLLGTHLPMSIQSVLKTSELNNISILIYILSISFILLTIRFTYFRLMHNFEKKGELKFKQSIKRSLLYSISGVRGSITLVSALSLPIFLNNGALFKERDILITLASGVILTTLLLANFVMPLLAEKQETILQKNNIEIEITILKKITKQLRSQIDEENRGAIKKVLNICNSRILFLIKADNRNSDYQFLQKKVVQWKVENTLRLLKEDEIALQVAFLYLRRLNKSLDWPTKTSKFRKILFYVQLINAKKNIAKFKIMNAKEKIFQRRLLEKNNIDFIIDKLNSFQPGIILQEIVDHFIEDYKQSSYEINPENKSHLDEWLNYAVQLEREAFQLSFETGNITRHELKIYREQLLAIENNIPFLQY